MPNPPLFLIETDHHLHVILPEVALDGITESSVCLQRLEIAYLSCLACAAVTCTSGTLCQSGRHTADYNTGRRLRWLAAVFVQFDRFTSHQMTNNDKYLQTPSSNNVGLVRNTPSA